MPAADVDGLFTLHRAYLETVPYEDLAVQLGETGPLDFPLLASRVSSGRGGYCFELNTVLAGLLRACGFEVTHHQAVVGGEGLTNHMVLLVPIDGETLDRRRRPRRGLPRPAAAARGHVRDRPVHVRADARGRAAPGG